MKPPSYEKRCARRCVDNRDAPVMGNQWVHAFGVTMWVCSKCAAKIARAAGIKPQKRLTVAPETHISRGHQARLV